MKPACIIAFLLLSLRASAHQDIVYTIHKGNIHIDYLSGWYQVETGKKIRIFAEITDKLLKIKNFSTPLYIYFGHDYTKSDTCYYTLGFGEFSYWSYEKYKPLPVKANGIKILIRDRDFDIKKMLLLVNHAFSNIEYIKDKQVRLHLKNWRNYTDTINSIRSAEIEQYMSTPAPAVETLLSEKHYRNIDKVKENTDIDYFFQHNQFHFYNTTTAHEKWSESQQRYITKKVFGKEILAVNNIYEIFGNINDGHFVFTDDSTFYYIDQLENKVQGPYKIDSVRPGRPPVYKYHHEHTPMEKFTLFIDYNGKALFIPDSNLLISNYEKIENGLMNNYSAQKGVKKTDNIFNKTTLLLCTLLGLSIIANIWLLMGKTGKRSV